MLQLLFLIVTSIIVVSSDINCPDFSNYPNNVTLLNELNGEYLVVYTTSTNIINCERISWSLDPNNNPTSYLKDSSGCCRQITNFHSSSPDYYQHDITPLSPCTHLQSTEHVAQKLVASTGAGNDLCLIVYVCHPSRKGLLVKCRQQSKLSVLTIIYQILRNLLRLVLPIPVLQTVNQNSCVFPNDCFF